MAVIGLSKPYYATYTNTSGTITYGALTSLAKACEVTIDVDAADDVILYADNGPAEVASGFSGGTLTLTVDELSIAAAGAILGITPASSSTPSGSTLTFGGNDAAPYLGFGIVVKKMVGGTVKWMAVALRKVKFRMPSLTATTQGETIEFQTPELTATILRDDSANADWCAWGQFDSEADAVTWLGTALPTGT